MIEFFCPRAIIFKGNEVYLNAVEYTNENGDLYKSLLFRLRLAANGWEMSGYMEFYKKNKWEIIEVKFEKMIYLKSGKIILGFNAGDFIEPNEFIPQYVKDYLIKIYESIRKLDEETVKNIVEKLREYEPLINNDRLSLIIYEANSEKRFHVSMDLNDWLIIFHHNWYSYCKGDDIEIMVELKNLIFEMLETGNESDEKLRDYCFKIIKNCK
ncbi:MAG: hypothetical protein RMJ67_09580 [Elusimicrobiota bacterium]|nr:DUF5007 domain-containing protein [Endomicrobiia bacterium]MDW8166745.1 hypothetical protein [Elusimicrobiota bacterium]